MNNVDSDLEEGEIIDDSPSPSSDSDIIVRELPRRYTIQKNRDTRIHKHRKKDCKNSIRYHAKKLAKLKKSPEKLKDINKKHHKSTCPHDKSSKLSNKSDLVVKKHNLTKNDYSFPKQSLIAEMKSSLKDHSIDIQKVILKPKKDLSKFESKNVSDDKLLNGKDIQTNDNSLDDSKQCSQKSVQNSEDISVILEAKPDNTKLSNELLSKSPEVKNEESEDEEELRKIALATFSKRKPDAELPKALIENEDNSGSLEINKSFSLPEINNIESDNYEVIDMDVDEDTEAAIEVFEKPLEGQLSEFTENLYVIDNKPFVEDGDRSTLSEIPIHNSSDEDFEADILRAELIQSMYHKKSLLEDDEVSKQNQQPPIVPRKNCVSNYQKPNNKFYHKHLKPKHMVRKVLTKKSENLSYNASKPVAPNNQLQISKKPPERIIISLNEESSSEESESQEENLAPEKSIAPENPVASIEALISDCRQKSESSEKNQEVAQPVSRAVSCLSKAQQEEYQSLVKILAEKEKLPTPAENVQNKNGSTNSPLNDLKLMEKKLLKFKEDLQKKNEYLKLLSKEINSKKLLYMKSKLSAQLLKEQYLRAEKVRKNNLGVWSQSCSHFKNVKKTVSTLENKIDELQKLYIKLGACIQEKTYNSPSHSINNSNSPVS